MSQKRKTENDFNFFVGGATGAFKGIMIDSKATIVKNLQNVMILKPENEISILNWSNPDQSEILIGTVDQIVKIYDIEFKAYSNSLETKFGSGPLVGLTRINGAVTTCSQSGHIKVWMHKKSEELELSVGAETSRMQKCDETEGIVATGGQKNDLKIWDLEKKTKIFCAKNVKKDMLQLEVPIWISDIKFLPDSQYKIAVTTRHGQVRLYDTKTQRRPVVDINLKEKALNTISLCYNPYHVVIGSTTGHVMLADLRTNKKILHAYKGAVGSIRQVTAHPDLPYVASVGLDRFLRVHHLESKTLLHQEYLKVRLNCVLMKSSFGKEIEKYDSESEEEKIECVDLESDEEFSKMFNDMENVVENVTEPVKKKIKKK